jgi:uncharacterized protein (DUF736 family)
MAKKVNSVKIGAGWYKFTENGKQYLSIKLDEAIQPLTITPDKYLLLWEISQEEQKTENSPHFTVHIAKNLEE